MTRWPEDGRFYLVIREELLPRGAFYIAIAGGKLLSFVVTFIIFKSVTGLQIFARDSHEEFACGISSSFLGALTGFPV